MTKRTITEGMTMAMQITDEQVQDYIDRHATRYRRQRGRGFWLPAVWLEDDAALCDALVARLGRTVPSGYMSEECGWEIDEDEVSEDMRGDDDEEDAT